MTERQHTLSTRVPQGCCCTFTRDTQNAVQFPYTCAKPCYVQGRRQLQRPDAQLVGLCRHLSGIAVGSSVGVRGV
jgi:hypothetical protein